MIICKVKENKISGHKHVTIPKGEPIEKDDYVVIRKVMPEDLEGNLTIGAEGGKEI